MTEVRCMMCGKPNPVEAEVCQHCQARIKPLIGAPTGDEMDQPQAPDAGGSVSTSSKWIDSLHPDGDDDAELGDDRHAPGSPSPSETSQQDWLESLRRDSGELPELDWEEETDDEVWLDSADISLSSEAEYVGDKFPKGRDTLASEELPTTPEIPSKPPDLDGQEVEPEWLRRVRTRQQNELPDISGVSADSDLGSSPASAPDEKVSSESKTTSSGLPEWLSEFEDKTPAVDETSDLPDWLQVEQPVEHATPVDQDRRQDELPEWLSEISAANKDHSGEADAVTSPAVAPFTNELEGSGTDIAEEQDVVSLDLPGGSFGEFDDTDPEWLSGLSAMKAAELDIEPEAPEDGIPDWLSDLERSAPTIEDIDLSSLEDEPEINLEWVEEKSAGDDALSRVKDEVDTYDDLEFPEQVGPFIGDIPELLDDDLILPDALGKPVESSPDEIEQADLPVWLESMRPLGAAAVASSEWQDSDTQVESSGPLAGLQGVLPAEPEIARIKHATAFSIKLNVSEKQQTHAAALNQLVRAEAEAKPLPKRPVFTSQNMLRLVILAVLVIVIGWTVYTGSQTQPVPGFSQGIFDTNTVINQLPEKAPVLLAVDYEPGLTGEMEAVSSAVIDHLMIKGAYLALMSTSPTGPAQAERLIDAVNSRGDHQYTGVDQYANLGYIPGGATGLLAFASSPRQVLPFSTDGSMIWESEPLSSIDRLEQFALVVVVSEDPDKARAWIEQVQPQLGSTPLVMLLSAQAEPLILPYYEGGSHQLQGLVAGLSGGASYEQFINRPGPGRQYWDSFSLASITAVLLILLGGIINLMSDRLTPPKILRRKSKS